MPKNFEQLDEQKSIKMLLVGNAGSGKTGALAGLANAGFRLRVLDVDNNLAPLLAYTDPSCRGNISAHQLGERIKFNAATMAANPSSKTKVFKNAMRAMDDWNFDEKGEDGYVALPIEDMTQDDVIVVDSANLLGKAIVKYTQETEGSLGKKMRIQDWGTAGAWFLTFIENLVSDEIKANVVIITHLTGVEMEDDKMVFFPAAVSKGTHMDFPKYFDTMVLGAQTGAGSLVKRVIRTKPTTSFATKCVAECGDNLDLDIALPLIFKAMGVTPKEGLPSIDLDLTPKVKPKPTVATKKA